MGCFVPPLQPNPSVGGGAKQPISVREQILLGRKEFFLFSLISRRLTVLPTGKGWVQVLRPPCLSARSSALGHACTPLSF